MSSGPASAQVDQTMVESSGPLGSMNEAYIEESSKRSSVDVVVATTHNTTKVHHSTANALNLRPKPELDTGPRSTLRYEPEPSQEPELDSATPTVDVQN